MSVCAGSTPTPAGPQAPDHYRAAAWPWVIEQPRLPRGVFRRSIAWLPDSLFTLRRTGYPVATQNSLPAVGQTLPDGLSTRKVPTEGFRVLSSSHPPSPSLLGAIEETEARSAPARSARHQSEDTLGIVCPRAGPASGPYKTTQTYGNVQPNPGIVRPSFDLRGIREDRHSAGHPLRYNLNT